LLTDRQTDKHGQKHVPPALSEVNNRRIEAESDVPMLTYVDIISRRRFFSLSQSLARNWRRKRRGACAVDDASELRRRCVRSCSSGRWRQARSWRPHQNS